MKLFDAFDLLDGPRLSFEALSLFDWLTPLFKVGQSIKRDGLSLTSSWTFFVPNTKAVHLGWSQGYIIEMLRQNGIEVYGDMVSFGELSFRVPMNQAAQAEELMNEAGIPIKPRSQGAPRR